MVLTDGDIFGDPLNLTAVISSPKMQGVERFAIGVSARSGGGAPPDLVSLEWGGARVPDRGLLYSRTLTNFSQSCTSPIPLGSSHRGLVSQSWSQFTHPAVMGRAVDTQ